MILISSAGARPCPTPCPASMYLEDVSAFQTRHEKFSEQLRRRKSTDHLYFLYRYAVTLRYNPYRLEPAQIIFTVNLSVFWPGRDVIHPPISQSCQDVPLQSLRHQGQF